jgi:hypothetical protein
MKNEELESNIKQLQTLTKDYTIVLKALASLTCFKIMK